MYNIPVRVNVYRVLYIGAMDPRCKICIFMGKTDPNAPKYKQQVHTYLYMHVYTCT